MKQLHITNIEKCEQCPYYYEEDPFCLKHSNHLYEGEEIPEWCELEEM
jgi:hypothetical protein